MGPVSVGLVVASAASDASIHRVCGDVSVGDGTAHAAPEWLAEQGAGFDVSNNMLRIRLKSITFQVCIWDLLGYYFTSTR